MPNVLASAPNVLLAAPFRRVETLLSMGKTIEDTPPQRSRKLIFCTGFFAKSDYPDRNRRGDASSAQTAARCCCSRPANY